MARAAKRPSTSVNEKDSIKIAKADKTISVRGDGKEKQITKPSESIALKPMTSSKSPLEDHDDDVFKYLLHHESKFRIAKTTFLNPSSSVISRRPSSSSTAIIPDPVTSKCRRILMDWLIQAHQKFELNPETLHLTVSIVDRILAQNQTTKDELQLLGISAMFLASKYVDIELPVSHDYELITGETFTKKQILQMERLILDSLKFDISAPSTLSFSPFFAKFLLENFEFLTQKSLKTHEKLVNLFGELAFFDAFLATVTNGRIAGATWILAITVVEIEKLEIGKVRKMICKKLDMEMDVMTSLVKKMAKVVHLNFGHEKLVAVKKKYQTSKFGQTSQLLTDDVMAKIRKIGGI